MAVHTCGIACGVPSLDALLLTFAQMPRHWPVRHSCCAHVTLDGKPSNQP